ncbi:hypothetical protein KQR54_26145 [Mycobacterium gordonae]|uniref:hypothetical protein n=1 Tax=Mycobacterium gordonae TaxID=1778 RepID=UPI00210E1D60|nr:hypothetical protein [Mycobacterium gordonae]MCQ4364564.1 hypothetical protein [Mycobacterium gordonae]
MALSPAVAHHRAKLAGLHGRPTDDPEVEAARRDLAAAKAAEVIKKLVAQAPPFTPEQVAQLRVLLEPARAELSRATAVADRLAELDGGA